MEDKHLTLHEQKVIILGRLIKETTLTLEEALLLLKEEEKEEPITVQPHWNPSIGTNPWTSSGTRPGTIMFGTTGSAGIGIRSDSGNTITTQHNMADATL